jgi:hypothetical protein
MRRLVAVGVLTGVLAMSQVQPALAGASADAALGLGAFAVFNQLVRGETVFNGILGQRPAVAVQQPVVVAPPPPVYVAPPRPVYVAPPQPVYVVPPPQAVVVEPQGRWAWNGAQWVWVQRGWYPRERYYRHHRHYYDDD